MADSKVLFFHEIFLDHYPCVVNFDANVVSKPMPFRFFNMWAKAEEFDSIVQNVWTQNIQGVKMYQIVVKLKHLKPMLKNLNKTKYVDIEKEIEVAFKMMHMIQKQIHDDPGNQMLYKQEKEMSRKYGELNEARINFWKQKLKEDWIHLGDSNSAYFHAVLKKKRAQNSIYRLKNIEGEWVEDAVGMEHALL